MPREELIPKHGGYRKLKSFRLAQLIYDLTVRFCDRYIDKKDRTRDQMVQAARSGTQNIAEGSQASGTSKKMELKLTNVARASLEELRLDYEDFLRQRGLPQLVPNDSAMLRFKKLRCSTLDQVVEWVHQEHARSWPAIEARAKVNADTTSVSIRAFFRPRRQCRTISLECVLSSARQTTHRPSRIL